MKIQSLAFWFGILILCAGILAGCSQVPAANTLGTETPVTVQSTRVITVIVRTTPTRVGTEIPAAAPTSTATPSSPPNVSPTALKYRLMQEFGAPFFCDRDQYPVAHEVSDEEIARRVAELRQNAEEYEAILAQLGLQGVTNLSPAQNRLIDAEHKQLNAIQLESADGQFKFALRTVGSAARGLRIEGSISAGGVIRVTSQQPSFNDCPICLAGSTLIDTPHGAVPVRDLQVGMQVWTANHLGVRERAVILQTVRRPVPTDVLLVQLVLDDGRELLISPAHPTFDERRAGDLVVGDSLDGARVVSVNLVLFDEGATYDILPSGETGAYWANRVLLGSTLAVK